jgi:hypothetical protein
MDTFTFRCKSCSAALRAPADRVGQKVRCGKCKTVVVIPAPEITEPQLDDLPIVDDYEVKEEKPRSAKRYDDESDSRSEKASSESKKRPRRTKNNRRQDALGNARGWFLVRIGMIEIVVSLFLVVLMVILAACKVSIWQPLVYSLQGLPIVGYILCAFVPLKGTARYLALANLAVIFIGLAITLGIRWGGIRSIEQAPQGSLQAAERNEELNRRFTEALKQAQQDLSKQLADAQRQIQERGRAAFTGPQFEIHMPFEVRLRMYALQWPMWQVAIQIVLLAFFVQAIAREFEDEGLAANCPRVAMMAVAQLLLHLAL